MTPEIFFNHVKENPHLVFTLTQSRFIPIEKTFCQEYGTYNVFKRDFYTKSNLKKCYVDTFVKEIKVERNKLCPCNNGIAYRVKHKYLQEVLIENGIKDNV